jgi:predicted DNA-binding transcriptional regulator AlpA
MNVENISPSDLLDVGATCKFIGGDETPIDRSTLYRGVSSGLYPKPIKITQSAVRWLRPELHAMRAAAMAAREMA